MSYPKIDIPEPSCEPPAGYYTEIPDDSLQCSECGAISADKCNNELGLELGTCWREPCQYAAVKKLKAGNSTTGEGSAW